MIVDNIANISRYDNIPFIKESFSYLKEYSDPEKEIGKYVINDHLNIVINNYITNEPDQNKFENHQKYIDIQYVKSGTEEIRICKKELTKEFQKYNDEADYEFCTPIDDFTSVVLNEGDFAVIWPDETHQPQLSVNNNHKKVEKVIFKVKI